MARHKPSARHIGFEAAAEKASESYGGDIERGRAAIAAATRRNKRGAAGKANPHLKRVKG
jgi:hypothetical protein